jgi:hypothetical protein
MSDTEFKEPEKIQLAFDLFAEIGKLSVLQELKIRLVANKIEGIESTAFSFSVKTTEDAVYDYFVNSGELKEDERKFLEQTRKIRNKILHCEFDTALRLIEELGDAKLPTKVVHQLNVKGLDGEGLLDMIFNAQSQISKGKISDERIKDVSDLKPEEAGLYGWFLHLAASGALNQALKAFEVSNEALNRLSEKHAKRDLDK